MKGFTAIRMDAHDYAERIRERLPTRLQELQEAMGLINVPPSS